MITKSQKEIKSSIIRFIEEHKDFNYEKGQSQPYWTNFFNCFGLSVSDYGTWAEKRAGRSFMDYFCPKMFLIEQKTEGKDLDSAYAQAIEYVRSLSNDESPRFVIVSDFKKFRIKDLHNDLEYPIFIHNDLESMISLWVEIFGGEKQYREEFELTVQAGTIMADLHDSLQASGYVGKDLELLLIRLLFCLFADDIGIFDKNMFWEEVEKVEANHLGSHINLIFNLMNEEPSKRQKNQDTSHIPYVNGGLFEENIKHVQFDQSMKEMLLRACEFDWTSVSPIVFGSIFQYAMDDERRREFGAHFTTIENIKKTIEPLFMDNLWLDYTNILENQTGKKQKDSLNKLLQKLGSLVIFDPACGSGNFLTVAYTELRKLENTIIRKLYPDSMLATINVNINNFYGVEIEEFPSYVARVSMWLTEQQMFIDLAKRYGSFSAKLPLKDSAHIVHGNSLRLDWGREVLEGKKPSYIIGNPPFVGKQFQSTEQKADVSAIFSTNAKAKSLDYVACWHKKASEFLKTSPDTEVAFVSTNSICQGEQVPILWKDLFDNGVKINFAHKTFQWTSEIKSKDTAKVYVIIVGFARFDRTDKKLYEYLKPTVVDEYIEHSVGSINAYLVEGVNVFIENRSKPLLSEYPITWGTQPIDGGNFLLTEEEKDELLNKEPLAEKWIREYIGGYEFLNNKKRYCLWLNDISPNELNTLPLVKARVEGVRQFRLASNRDTTKKNAEFPTLFGEIREGTVLKQDFLAVPDTSSESREYIPIGYVNGNNVGSTINCIFNAPKWLFAILTSRMHMAWMRTVAGRLESRYRYSNTLVYNNYPFPTLDSKQEDKLTELAEAILSARAAYPDASLADLYHPTTMPPALRKVHTTLDTYVDSLYAKKGFTTDSERITMLLLKYQDLINEDMLIKTKVKKVRGKKK